MKNKHNITNKDIINLAYKSILSRLEELYCSTYKSDEVDYDFINKLKLELQLLIHSINSIDFYKKYIDVESEVTNEQD